MRGDDRSGRVSAYRASRFYIPSVAPAPVELPLGVPFLAWEPADVEGAAAAPRFDEDGQEG